MGSAFDHSPSITVPSSSTNTGIVTWSGTGANTFLDSTVLVVGNNITIPGTITFGGTQITSTAAELNLLDGVSGLVQGDFTKLAAVDATAAELNLLNGVSGLVQADLTKLAAIDASAAEINKLDGAGSNVTATNLDALTGGGATALHSHSGSGISFSGSTANGMVTYGSSSSAIVEPKLIYDGDGMLTMANSSGSNNWLNHATATSGTANPSRLILRTASGNAGDTYISFHGVDTYEYSVGVDTSDVGSGGRRFKISGSALGTNDKLTLQPDGRFVINPTSATNPVGSGPFAIKAFSSNDVNLEMYCAGSDDDAGYRFRTYERGSGGSSGTHAYVQQSYTPIMTPGGAGSRGAIVWVHGEQDGDTNTFCDMVVGPVTGGFSNGQYSSSGSSVGSGNVIFRLNVRGSPSNRDYSLGATNTLYLAMASGNYNVVTMCMGLSGLAT